MSIPIETRKRWWLLCYGFTSMNEALRGCDMLFSVCDTNKHPAYLPITYYIHTQYGRPFHHNHGVGTIEREIIPEETMHHHRWLMEFRDAVFSHSDSEPAKESGKILNRLVFTVKEDDFIFYTSDPRPALSSYLEARSHIEIIRSELAKRVFVMKKQHEELIPKELGDYLLSLDHIDQPFLPYARPESATLIYKRAMK